MTTETKLDISLLLARVTVALIILAHGVQKLFGWFGGYGYDGTMAYFTESVGLPYMLGLAIIVAETFGMLALLSGLFTRFLSGSIILIMLGAVLTEHLANGFYMNWSGTNAGEGFELHLLVIILATLNVLFGAGRYSLKEWITRKLRKKHLTDGMYFI